MQFEPPPLTTNTMITNYLQEIGKLAWTVIKNHDGTWVSTFEKSRQQTTKRRYKYTHVTISNFPRCTFKASRKERARIKVMNGYGRK
jgi:hypothetical protein